MHDGVMTHLMYSGHFDGVMDHLMQSGCLMWE